MDAATDPAEHTGTASHSEVSVIPRLIVFTRYPTPGACKTRLIPRLGAQGAASVHRQLTERTVDVLRQSGCAITIAYTGADEHEFREWLGDDLAYARQCDGDLTERLAAFADQAPLVFLGADTPDLEPDHVAACIAGLQTHRVVIGPAEDGGYYLIGIREPLPQLFSDISWSTSLVLAQTRTKLDRMEITPLMLEVLADCDEPDDLNRWPDLQP